MIMFSLPREGLLGFPLRNAPERNSHSALRSGRERESQTSMDASCLRLLLAGSPFDP
jgi:hypothetical protein